jgi:hypothetical protein
MSEDVGEDLERVCSVAAAAACDLLGAEFGVFFGKVWDAGGCVLAACIDV